MTYSPPLLFDFHFAEVGDYEYRLDAASGQLEKRSKSKHTPFETLYSCMYSQFKVDRFCAGKMGEHECLVLQGRSKEGVSINCTYHDADGFWCTRAKIDADRAVEGNGL